MSSSMGSDTTKPVEPDDNGSAAASAVTDDPPEPAAPVPDPAADASGTSPADTTAAPEPAPSDGTTETDPGEDSPADLKEPSGGTGHGKTPGEATEADAEPGTAPEDLPDSGTAEARPEPGTPAGDSAVQAGDTAAAPSDDAAEAGVETGDTARGGTAPEDLSGEPAERATEASADPATETGDPPEEPAGADAQTGEPSGGGEETPTGTAPAGAAPGALPDVATEHDTAPDSAPDDPVAAPTDAGASVADVPEAGTDPEGPFGGDAEATRVDLPELPAEAEVTRLDLPELPDDADSTRLDLPTLSDEPSGDAGAQPGGAPAEAETAKSPAEAGVRSPDPLGTPMVAKTPMDTAGAAGADAAREPVEGAGTATPATASMGSVAGPDEGKDAAVGAAAEQEKATGGRRRRRRKQRSRLVRYSRRAAFGLLLFLGLAVAAFAVAYMLTPVPSPQEDATAQGPEFYYSDGKTLIAKIGVNRHKVDLEAVPQHVRDAVIAAENRSFYEDPGVSIRGTIRAFWSTVSGEQLQGGSTITQQMVRNYYQGLGQERTVNRKLKEIMVSLKVGSQRDKDWILEQYLNTIYFGRDAYGIQAAAQAYYDKDVGDLTKAEAAYLAAAIQQPTPFGNPYDGHRAMAEERWRSVVTAMTETGALTPAEAAAMKFPMPIKQKVTDILRGQIGYMVRIAQKELRERRGYTEDQINRGGLKITTTFDKRLMEAAEKAVEDTLPEGVGKTTLTGLVSVDPATGQVVAFYGGRGYLEEQLSTAFGHWAQAGSGFKPIVLAAALADGKTLGSVVDGSSPQYYNGFPVRNSGGTSYGMINLVTATQNSVNTGYVRLGQEIGLDKVSKMAEKMGIPKEQLTANDANKAPTFPLGVISVHPVQQAGVYATFAAEGIHRTPYVVKSVTELDGDKRTFTEKGERVFSEQVARDATYAMTKVVESGTGTNARLYDGRDVAGKTGTTDNGNALWFNGFIPQMATSVAIFRSDSPSKQVQIGGYSAFGGVLPAQIWRAYMTAAVAIKDLEPKSFGAPSSYTSGGGGYTRTSPQPDGPLTPRPDSPQPRPTRPIPRPSEPGPGDPSNPGDPGDPGGPQDPPQPPPPGDGGGDGGGGGGGGNRQRDTTMQQAEPYDTRGRRE